MTSWERKYTVTEPEALAVVWGFDRFCYFLLGHHTIVRTDHNALAFLLCCKLLHSRLTRWILALQEYSFEIQYIPGEENVVHDTLLRLTGDLTGVRTESPRVKEIKINFI